MAMNTSMVSMMFVRFGKSKTIHQVGSFEEAGRKFSEMEKSSQEKLIFKMPFADILDADMNKIARISPNGRIWDMNEKVIQERIKI